MDTSNFCSICNVSFNTEQKRQHFNSSDHQKALIDQCTDGCATLIESAFNNNIQSYFIKNSSYCDAGNFLEDFVKIKLFDLGSLMIRNYTSYKFNAKLFVFFKKIENGEQKLASFKTRNFTITSATDWDYNWEIIVDSLLSEMMDFEVKGSGWTMDAIVAQVGKKNNCTFCGVFRRQALDRGAASLNVDHIVTGHNADDIAETVLMNSQCKRTVLAIAW